MRLLRVFVLVALLGGAFVSSASAGGYTDASYYTPVGKVGTPYSHTVSWKPGTGCPPFTYAVVGGAFPPGLSLSSNGNITGTPTLGRDLHLLYSADRQLRPRGRGQRTLRDHEESLASPFRSVSVLLVSQESSTSRS